MLYEKTILYLIGSLDVGGTENHLINVLPRLHRLGWRPTVYCLWREGDQAAAMRALGIPVIAPPIKSLQSNRTAWALSVRVVATCLRVLILMLSAPPQIVHFFLPAAYLAGAPLAMVAGLRIRIMSRRGLNLYQTKSPFARKVEVWLHRHMTALCGNSNAVVQELFAEGCPRDKVYLIYNGIDCVPISAADARARSRQRLNIPLQAFVIVIVANLIAYKGHENILDALVAIKGKLPQPWRLLCAGRDDGLLTPLRHQAQQFGLTKNIEFLGLRSDVADILAAADLYVSASHQEGFSNSILEAMASGLPVIATKVGGNAEAVIEGTTGLLVAPNSPENLAAAILRLAADPAQMKQMGAAGRHRVETEFSLDRCVDQYDTMYRGLLNMGTLTGIDGTRQYR
jgi:glycosyltransferase involved in cell wall biosynthesis